MNDNILGNVAPNRRDFVKRILASGAIAVPIISSFSLSDLPAEAQTVTSSSYLSSSGVPCPVDQGYNGPTRFAAHLTYVGYAYDMAASINGEMRLHLEADNDNHDRGRQGDHGHGKSTSSALDNSGDPDDATPDVRRVATEFTLAGSGVTVGSVALLINGSYAAALQPGRSSFNAADVNYNFCNLDFVLNGIAAGQATILVSATYLGINLNLSGPVVAAGPDQHFVNLKPE